MQEIWRVIKGFEDYEVSNLGGVRSLTRLTKHWRGGDCVRKGATLKARITKSGYSSVCLYDKGKKRQIKVHQLVAIGFLNHTLSGMTLVIDHKNEVKTDNNVDNLQIMTQKENLSKYWRNKHKQNYAHNTKTISRSRN